MKILEHLFKPSSLITIVLIIVFILFAFGTNKDPSFYSACGDAIKILCGALAGAVAGEKYSEKEKNESTN